MKQYKMEFFNNDNIIHIITFSNPEKYQSYANLFTKESTHLILYIKKSNWQEIAKIYN